MRCPQARGLCHLLRFKRLDEVVLSTLVRISRDHLIPFGQNQFNFIKRRPAFAVAALASLESDLALHVDHMSHVASGLFRFDLTGFRLNQFVRFVYQPKNIVAVSIKHAMGATAIGVILGMLEYMLGSVPFFAARAVDQSGRRAEVLSAGRSKKAV